MGRSKFSRFTAVLFLALFLSEIFTPIMAPPPAASYAGEESGGQLGQPVPLQMTAMRKILDRFYHTMWGLRKTTVGSILVETGHRLQIITPVVFFIYSAYRLGSPITKVFVISYAVSEAIQGSLKVLFNNPRPNETEGTVNPPLKLEWSVDVGDSFPSGHTMSAMTGGIFWFQMRYICGYPVMGIIGVLLGIVTGLSRIISRSHWLRDVAASWVTAAMIYWVAKTRFIGRTSERALEGRGFFRRRGDSRRSGG
jgi:membrane-associated phospholipid phosphatase